MEKKEDTLSAFRLTMMALGTVIGGSFFLGSSVAIHAAGPAILISYIFGGILVYFILYALSEMTVANPDGGSFRTFAAQTMGKGAGFVTGWVYWTGMVLAMSSEATAVSILFKQWFPNISIAILGSAIIIGITLINLLGADKLSRLESGLAAIKVLAVVSFVIMAILLIIGLFPGKGTVGLTQFSRQPFMPSGLGGIAGSMLIVMFSYAGFEIIGLAAPEAKNPKKTVPRAINYTVISLIMLFILCIGAILPLIPTDAITEAQSPIVAALEFHGISWAGTALNIVMITAILSTMLAAMFGLGRMLRSLAKDKMAPAWAMDKTDIPYRGILLSGLFMLIALGTGLLFPNVYLFLISSGGFAVLFTYAVIMLSHIKFRKKYGCPPDGNCQIIGYPYTSILVFISLLVIIFSMPFVKGQADGLLAGLIVVAFFALSWFIIKLAAKKNKKSGRHVHNKGHNLTSTLSTEYSKELADNDSDIDKTDVK